jgi:hypothetical protein
MSDPTPHTHPTEDDLLELALEGVSESRAPVLHHLRTCLPCRASYDELTRVLDATLAASPAIAPPPGFETRVLARLAPDRQARPPARRRVPLLVAAAAAVGLLLGGVATSVVERADTPPAAPSAASPAPRLRTPGGDVVGSVLRSSYHGRDVLVMSVHDARPGAEYACRVRLEDGSTVAAGSWTVPASGEAVWITPVTAGAGRVELVSTYEGTLWASADLAG